MGVCNSQPVKNRIQQAGKRMGGRFADIYVPVPAYIGDGLRYIVGEYLDERRARQLTSHGKLVLHIASHVPVDRVPRVRKIIESSQETLAVISQVRFYPKHIRSMWGLKATVAPFVIGRFILRSFDMADLVSLAIADAAGPQARVNHGLEIDLGVFVTSDLSYPTSECVQHMTDNTDQRIWRVTHVMCYDRHKTEKWKLKKSSRPLPNPHTFSVG